MPFVVRIWDIPLLILKARYATLACEAMDMDPRERLSEYKRRRILTVARQYFLETGIKNAEMKELAERVGIGRSTLYRYFSEKEDIALILTGELLTELFEQSIPPEGLNGYDSIYWHIMKYQQILFEHPEYIRFFVEFDYVFTGEYPDTKEAEKYVASLRRMNRIVVGYMRRGLEDGSIRPLDTPEVMCNIMMNVNMGLAQRLLPRSAHYEAEEGQAGYEIAKRALELMMEHFKA